MLSGSVVPKGTRVPFRAFIPHSRAGLASHVAGATRRSSSPHKSSSYHLILPLEHDPDRLRVRDVLLLEDTSGEGVLVIIVVRKHRLLHDDGAVIEFFVDEMHRASGHLHAVGERFLLGLEARE